tara:strand:- start:356 stop:1186 length:831 start_codon:yes stop_codon:yes gene_type:complete
MDINLESTQNLSSFNNKIFNINPIILLIISAVILMYFILFSSLGGNKDGSTADSGEKSVSKVFLETILWSVFIILILLNGLYYLFDIDLMATMKNMFKKESNIDIYVDNTNDDFVRNQPLNKEEVYHIPDNKYTYNDAKAICKANGARLATYKEVEAAYRNGGDWCGYGWSDNQMALYPTQYDKWVNLQKIDNHENDCGRPGVNGGYIDNKNVRFGVNCYGRKPGITPEERQKMSDTPLYPLTQKEINFNKRVDYWKEKLPEILYSPFNNSNWNMI